jgi:hypothetical protein
LREVMAAHAATLTTTTEGGERGKE